MGFYKNAGGMSHPTTKRELIEEINIRLERRQYNLNDIDTSRIIDMSNLFYNYSCKDVDVSQWDVSSVRTMDYMFYNSIHFDCDLSKWEIGRASCRERV